CPSKSTTPSPSASRPWPRMIDPSMNVPTVVGVQPWLPWPLHRWTWFTAPVRAERLAALRIGLAAVLLLDILTTYLPNVQMLYGRDSLGAPGLFVRLGPPPQWKWSLFSGVEEPWILRAGMILWALSTLSLLLGFQTRLSAIITWLLSTSFATLNT